MNLSKAERITGLTLTASKDGLTVTAKRGDHIVFTCRAKTQKEAIESIAFENYCVERAEAARQQGQRCFCCNRLGPIQTDHIVARGMGGSNRDDRRTNLRAMLLECHARRHRDPLNPPEPHPEILRRVAEHGYQWGGEERGWLKTST